MTNQDNENILNGVVVTMAHSFLQYVSEASLWVRDGDADVEEQVRVLAERQRQNVGDIAALLTSRDFPVDFGTFPTEYTDLQFLSLKKLMDSLTNSQQDVLDCISQALNALTGSGDAEAIELLAAIESHEHGIATAVSELIIQMHTTA
jgi:hypothetical protein